ncbi:pro-sigmaK processing inhibitor BofA family protein [Sulfoacidibacillus thermotolerans]|uniref:Pro-sigmaK processing inhibitor BofA n=1 Tax=Sulfoacidibacillus thermotolerans TaxID=1765684 RepID=A0A2U3D8C4_SULT2|nr:pro-sigmaK processing inhibitor BofA family protein [Sulfoacidibacillus thermotolerans]PWI57534.1 hypothetical protein BM613_07850 [Sulfoacidibacillus thermotolerans]
MFSDQTALWMALGILVVLIVAAQILRDPLSFFGVLLRNLSVGLLALAAIDYVGKGMGIHVPLNLQTAGVASVLGVPGVAALAIVQHWLL